MALWRCDIRVSWRTQLVFLLGHGALILLILLSPWPESYGVYWLLPLVLLVFACIRSQTLIAKNQGELSLAPEGELRWKGTSWVLCRTYHMSDFGVLLSLRAKNTGRSKRLWLAADSMRPDEWRRLRQYLLFPGSVSPEM
ncbi:protein YgfX [Enterobacillus tribolii]|uniref:Toxin CptA n=1 Tax=Enterobacillus tribolii TaxID=1487935 RepID=A0A370R238_9GAMM|nr:protein YgfX [Enterobacillus tribolii]MBW7982916.1 hypothetical protein [Enterobacillus tribolii]RDK95981.1 toxin CptA [Enterobacillus tribolii]